MSAWVKAPWFLCNGWWSPWCLLDIATRCKFPAICKRHDAEQVKAFERVQASLQPVGVKATVPGTWTTSTTPPPTSWSSSDTTGWRLR